MRTGSLSRFRGIPGRTIFRVHPGRPYIGLRNQSITMCLIGATCRRLLVPTVARTPGRHMNSHWCAPTPHKGNATPAESEARSITTIDAIGVRFNSTHLPRKLVSVNQARDYQSFPDGSYQDDFSASALKSRRRCIRSAKLCVLKPSQRTVMPR